MFRLRLMAGFAGDVGVAAAGAKLGLIVMAGDAGVLTGKGHRPLADHFERAWAIVAILTERLGDHGLPEQQEDS